MSFAGRHLELEEDDQVEATINTSFVILSVPGVIAFVGVRHLHLLPSDITEDVLRLRRAKSGETTR